MIKLGLPLLAIILSFFVWKNLPAPAIDTKTLKERIAVLPFENNTGNTDLEVLGNMAADWINTGLMEVENAEVVSPFTVRTHQNAIGILDSNPQNRPSFAELTGAKNLITGTYYKDRNELIFKLELIDAQDGQLLFSFNPVRGKEGDKQALLAALRNQVTGYWAAKDLVNAKKINPPNFAAYELYLDIHAFPHQMPIPESQEDQKTRYEKSNLQMEQKERYLEKVLSYMKTEKPYQESELTLAQLGALVNIPSYYVSQVINEKLNCNFLDFINGYRVKAAQEKLLDPKLSHYTIIGIANEAGFNSKSTFYTAFKKVTGMTPSQYRKKSGRKVA